MSKYLINNLKYNAKLHKLGEVVNVETDRVEMGYPFERIIKYSNLGITATDKFTTKPTDEIVKKIEVRLDRGIENNMKDYRFYIGGRMYKIERIYTLEDARRMEVSLSYDN